MRHLIWLVLLFPIQVGCGDSGNQVIDTSQEQRVPMTQAEIDAHMGGRSAKPAAPQ